MLENIETQKEYERAFMKEFIETFNASFLCQIMFVFFFPSSTFYILFANLEYTFLKTDAHVLCEGRVRYSYNYYRGIFRHRVILAFYLKSSERCRQELIFSRPATFESLIKACYPCLCVLKTILLKER